MPGRSPPALTSLERSVSCTRVWCVCRHQGPKLNVQTYPVVGAKLGRLHEHVQLYIRDRSPNPQYQNPRATSPTCVNTRGDIAYVQMRKTSWGATPVFITPCSRHPQFVLLKLLGHAALLSTCPMSAPAVKSVLGPESSRVLLHFTVTDTPLPLSRASP